MPDKKTIDEKIKIHINSVFPITILYPSPITKEVMLGVPPVILERMKAQRILEPDKVTHEEIYLFLSTMFFALGDLPEKYRKLYIYLTSKISKQIMFMEEMNLKPLHKEIAKEWGIDPEVSEPEVSEPLEELTEKIKQARDKAEEKIVKRVKEILFSGKSKIKTDIKSLIEKELKKAMN